MNKTKIEYLDYTWNPIAMRCTSISDGCRNCWHLAMAKRLTANPLLPREEQLAYAEDSDPEKGPPILRQKELEAPLRLKKPSRIGVQFMGDLFHESIPDGFRHSIFGIMGSEEVGKDTFFVLTKRPQRAKDYFMHFTVNVANPAELFPRVWLGVSVENQKTADERIPILLQIPAAHRWVSVEPMLGPTDLTKIKIATRHLGGGKTEPATMSSLKTNYFFGQDGDYEFAKFDWVVCGGETGPGARPLHPDWVRSLRDQCQAAGVPFFFKGWGEWAHERNLGIVILEDPEKPKSLIQYGLDQISHPVKMHTKGYNWPDGSWSLRVDHKSAGRLLDGREWNEIPK